MFKNTLLFSLGDIVIKALPFILLPYLTRILGEDEYGRLAYFQSIVTIFTILFGMSQGGSLTKYFFKYGRRSVEYFVTYANLMSLSLVLLFSIIFIFIENKLILCVFVALSTELLLSRTTLFICKREPLEYLKITLLASFLSIVFTVLLFNLSTPSVEIRMLSIFLSNMAVWFFIVRNKKISFRKHPRYLMVSKNFILNTSLPLIALQLSVILKGQIDRLYIYNKYSAYDLSIYSAAFQLSAPISIIILAFNKALQPYYFSYLRTVNNAKLTIKISILLLLTPLILYFISLSIPNDFFLWFLGFKEGDVSYFFIMFCTITGLIPSYLILSNYLVFKDKAKVLTMVSFLGLISYATLLIVFGSQNINYIPFAIFISNTLVYVILLFYVFRLNYVKKI